MRALEMQGMSTFQMWHHQRQRHGAWQRHGRGKGRGVAKAWGVAKAGGVDETSKHEKRRKLSVLAYRFWKTFWAELLCFECFELLFFSIPPQIQALHLGHCVYLV